MFCGQHTNSSLTLLGRRVFYLIYHVSQLSMAPCQMNARADSAYTHLHFQGLYRHSFSVGANDLHRKDLILVNHIDMFGQAGPLGHHIISAWGSYAACAKHILELVHAKGAWTRHIRRNLLTKDTVSLAFVIRIVWSLTYLLTRLE